MSSGTVSEIQENMFCVVSHEDRKVLENNGIQGLVKHVFSWDRHWTFTQKWDVTTAGRGFDDEKCQVWVFYPKKCQVLVFGPESVTGHNKKICRTQSRISGIYWIPPRSL